MGSASQLVGTVSRAFAAVVASARSDVAMSLIEVLRNIQYWVVADNDRGVRSRLRSGSLLGNCA